MIAANGRDDYGRASDECSTRKGNLVIITTKPATPRAHDYTVGTEAKSPLDHESGSRCRHALGYQLVKNTKEPCNDA
eukprot:6173928-Pleurochrysis_carterae.AAC.3